MPSIELDNMSTDIDFTTVTDSGSLSSIVDDAFRGNITPGALTMFLPLGMASGLFRNLSFPFRRILIQAG